MIGMESKELREDVRRWVEDGPGQLSALLGLLHDYTRLRERVEVAEREQERVEVAEQVSEMMNQLLLRLRPPQT